jgi:hypothetical protein
MTSLFRRVWLLGDGDGGMEETLTVAVFCILYSVFGVWRLAFEIPIHSLLFLLLLLGRWFGFRFRFFPLVSCLLSLATRVDSCQPSLCLECESSQSHFFFFIPDVSQVDPASRNTTDGVFFLAFGCIAPVLFLGLSSVSFRPSLVCCQPLNRVYRCLECESSQSQSQSQSYVVVFLTQTQTHRIAARPCKHCSNQ